MTPFEINQAWKLRAQGFSYRKIAEAIGTCSAKTIRLTLHPHGRRPARATPPKRNPDVHRVIKRINKPPPQEVLDAAERAYQIRMSAHLTLGQALLGDPLPGQSALDKRKSDVHSP